MADRRAKVTTLTRQLNIAQFKYDTLVSGRGAPDAVEGARQELARLHSQLSPLLPLPDHDDD
jgi:hypothetical protein